MLADVVPKTVVVFDIVACTPRMTASSAPGLVSSQQSVSDRWSSPPPALLTAAAEHSDSSRCSTRSAAAVPAASALRSWSLAAAAAPTAKAPLLSRIPHRASALLPSP
eukprot:SAG22_NODE_771_length_7318_cov_6.057487_6_plen_108_part_00